MIYYKSPLFDILNFIRDDSFTVMKEYMM